MTDRPSASAPASAAASAKRRDLKTILSLVGLAVAALAAFAAVASAMGTRLGLWHFRDGFQILRWAAYAGAGGAALSLIALLWRWRLGTRLALVSALAGLALGLASFGYPASLYRTARSVPPIHDVTTDRENPPAYVAILPLRAGAENPVAYPGGAVAKQQLEAYPGIKPARFDAPPGRVFEAALATASALGWEVAAAVPAEGRIEATDTSFWYHFKDDVAIRISADGQGTRLDIRSLSRVGRGDLGVNARRIERFMAALASRLAGK